MNVSRWTPTWWRRAQFVWIVPYVALAYLPAVLIYGVLSVGNPLAGFGDVWRGRRQTRV